MHDPQMEFPPLGAARSPRVAKGWRRWSIALLLGAMVLDLIGIGWGLPAFESWSNDDLTPIAPLSVASRRFAIVTRYPPVHYAILAAADAPYLGVSYLTGGFRDPKPDFPYGFRDPLRALSSLMLIGRLVSVVMGVGLVFFVARATLSLGGDPRAGLLAGAAIALNSQVVLFSHLGNVDVPALFWLAAALAGYTALLDRWRSGDAALLGAAGALSVGTKDQAYPALAGMALVLLAAWIRERRSIRPLLAGLGAFVVAYVAGHNVLFGWDTYVARVRELLGSQATVADVQFPATLAGYGALLERSLLQLADGSTWPILAASVAGMVVLGRGRGRWAALLVPALVYYAGYVGIRRYVLPRYVLPVALFLAPLAGIALARLLDGRSGRVLARRAGVGAVLVWAGLGAIRMDLGLLFDARYEAERYLREQVPVTARVEVYAPYTYLPRLRELGYSVEPVQVRERGPQAYTESALRARDPDVIVISYKPLTAADPEQREYFERLLDGRFGYVAKRFHSDLSWLGLPRDAGYTSRVNAPIWVLERRPGGERRPGSS